MPKLVFPGAFQLYGCPFDTRDSNRRKTATTVVRRFFRETENQRSGDPVTLRWSTSPLLGFPRQPFTVYRRRRYGLDQQNRVDPAREAIRRLYRALQADPLTVSTETVVTWGGQAQFEVLFAVFTGRSALTVTALDQRGDPLPGQRLVIPPGESSEMRLGRLRAGGIAALRVSGDGRIGPISGLSLYDLVNAPGWERIAVVGLPFERDEVALPLYNPLPQGYESPSLDGQEAARQRLAIATALHQRPTAPILSVSAPAWPAPDADRYLDYLRTPTTADGRTTPAPLDLIRDCLANSQDLDPDRLQVEYMETVGVTSPRQGDIPDARPLDASTQATLPVVAMTLLSASTESYAATGLGYGMVDFPPSQALPTDGNSQVLEPPGTQTTAYDYMVTNTFGLPTTSRLPLPPGLELSEPTVELAALMQIQPPPVPPASLAVVSKQKNRPPARDQPATEAVELSWSLSPWPQGYGVFVVRNRSVVTLNTPLPQSESRQPLIPERPALVDGGVDRTHRTRFVAPVSTLPDNVTYLVAGIDVFGRWSAWRLKSYSVRELLVQKPGLHSATLVPPAAETLRSLSGRVVSCTLEVELSWNWSDRSAFYIELAGRFFPATADESYFPQPATIDDPISPPDPTFLQGLALAEGDPTAGSAVTVTFDTAGNPTVPGPHRVTVLTSPPGNTADPNADVHRYRLTLVGMQCDYNSASPADSTLAYAVYARGAEVRLSEGTRNASSPGGWVGPATTRLADPILPPLPTLDPDLRWTALPDATGKARGVLSWPAVPNAIGYVVWEAAETTLRHVLEEPAPAVGSQLRDRALTLQGWLTTHTATSLQAFVRLTTEPLPASQTRLEVALPGHAETLYAYRVSAISGGNSESDRTQASAAALFAVPKRRQPGVPQLLLRPIPNQAALMVVALASAGAPPVGMRLYRTRKAVLTVEVGLMGPPVAGASDPRWVSLAPVVDDTWRTNPRWADPRWVALANYLLQSRDRGGLEDSSLIHGFALIDDLPPRWPPYYYRAVALGETNTSQGYYGGESVSSAMQQAVVPPTDPPQLINLRQGADQSTPLAQNLAGMALESGRKRLYIANQSASTLTVLHADTQSVLGTVAVGNNPIDVVLDAAAGRGYATNYSSNTVTVFNLDSLAVLATVTVGNTPWGMALAGNRLYVANTGSNTISVIATATNTVETTISLPQPPWYLAVDSRRNRLYASHLQHSSLSMVDLDGSGVTALTTPDGTAGLALDESRDRLWVSGYGSNTVQAIDPTADLIVATVSVGNNPVALALDTGRNHLYVANYTDGTLTVVNSRTERAIALLQCPGNPFDLAIHPDRPQVFVTAFTTRSLLSVGYPWASSQTPNRVLEVQTDLPPLADAQLTVERQIVGDRGRLERHTLLTTSLAEIPLGEPLVALAAPGPADLPALIRSAPVAGLTTLYLRFALADLPLGSALITVTDPLHRSTLRQEVP